MVPFSSAPDGSCLYNAVSLALYGTEAHSKRLRCLSIISFGLDDYEIGISMPNFTALITSDIRESLDDAINPNGWGNIYTVLALSKALNIGVFLIYPPVNGLFDRYAIMASGLFSASAFYSKTISLLWTRADKPPFKFTSREWRPNHFVPLIDKDLSNTADGIQILDSDTLEN